VALSAAGEDAGHIQRAKPRCSLPGVQDPTPGALNGIDVASRCSGNSRCTLEQIQERTLCPEHLPERSSEGADDRTAGSHCGAFGDPPVDRAVALRCHGLGEALAGEEAFAPVLY
jgi:hypothetical protein